MTTQRRPGQVSAAMHSMADAEQHETLRGTCTISELTDGILIHDLAAALVCALLTVQVRQRSGQDATDMLGHARALRRELRTLLEDGDDA